MKNPDQSPKTLKTSPDEARPETATGQELENIAVRYGLQRDIFDCLWEPDWHLRARLVREIKKGCTYRRLAEIYYPEDHPGHGNQGWGDELCFDAFKTLYPSLGHPFELSLEKIEELGPEFKKANKSRIGDFFWWE